MNPSDTLSHACHQALAAELGAIDVSPGTPARQALHNAAELVLRLHRPVLWLGDVSMYSY